MYIYFVGYVSFVVNAVAGTASPAQRFGGV